MAVVVESPMRDHWAVVIESPMRDHSTGVYRNKICSSLDHMILNLLKVHGNNTQLGAVEANDDTVL